MKCIAQGKRSIESRAAYVSHLDAIHDERSALLAGARLLRVDDLLHGERHGTGRPAHLTNPITQVR